MITIGHHLQQLCRVQQKTIIDKEKIIEKNEKIIGFLQQAADVGFKEVKSKSRKLPVVLKCVNGS